MSQRVASGGEVQLRSEPQRRRVIKKAIESPGADAKPGELSMGRLKQG